ncbi:MAG TPA: response regulator [Ramlibacter sp.]|nr:response regulator [Ramlibacter sp.]
MKSNSSFGTRATGASLCLLGAFVLLGWALGQEPMVRVLPGSTAMAINTAAMFLAAGSLLLLREWPSPARARAGRWLASLLVAWPAAILSQHLFGLDLGIDWASVHAAVGDGHAKPGRTAPNACVGFLLAGIVLLHPHGPAATRRSYWLTLVLASVTLFIGSTAFIGYLLRLEQLYRVASYNQMAALTSIGMTLVGAGVLAVALKRRPAAPQNARLDAARVTWRAVGLLTLFAAGTALTAFGLLKQSYENRAAENLLESGRKSALGVAALLEGKVVLASAVASRPVLSSSLARLAASPEDPLAVEQLRREEQSFLALGFSGAQLFDARGQQVGASGTMIGTAAALAVPIASGAAQGWLVWKDGYVYRSSHELRERGQVVGRLVLERRLQEFASFLTGAQNISTTSDVVLCAREGSEVVCFPSRFYPEPTRYPMFAADGKPSFPIVRALLGETGSTATQDARRIKVLAAFVPIPRYPLAMVEKLESHELYEPLLHYLPVLSLVILGFIALGAVMLRRSVQPMVERIASERQRMKAVLDNANDAFIAVDGGGRVTDWNLQAERVLGWTAGEVQGRALPDVLGVAGASLPADPSSPAGLQKARLELTARRKDGGDLPVELSIAPFKAGDEDAAGVFLRDLTGQKEAQRQLEHTRSALAQSQKLEAVGKLTGGVAHDFNNVLQVVGSNLQLVQVQLPPSSATAPLVQAALQAVDRGAKLSSQLLAFARRQPLQPVPFSINRRVQAMDDLLRRSLGEQTEIETVLAAGLWTTIADPNQLENVILNLAINARDAMPGGGKLTIETANAVLDEAYTAGLEEVQPGQYVMIAVSDTGVGMPQEVLARAFEPFYTTKPEGKGTGLGLSMAYGFAKQSGGHIRIYSEIGNGTTVKLYLPRSHEAEVDTSPSVEPAPAHGDETVLVVEDDLAVQASTVRLLQTLGYRVLRANDAEAALTVLKSGVHVDLLFTDVVMPGPLRSPELARLAKSLHPEIGVLFTSGYTQNAIVHGGRLDPGVELLSKPYRQEELARKVRRILDERPARRRPKASQALRVLLVEDQEDLRETVLQMLELMKVSPTAVGSAEAAEQELLQRSYDVLLTDIALPGRSGIELAQQALAAYPELRVVFTSGYGAALQPPPDLPHLLLPKPYGLPELQQLLQSLRPAQPA